MLEPKDYQKYIDEDINPGDYIVRELGGEYYVGQVIELSPNFYRYKVLNAFPLGEGVVRHEEAIKCYPTPLRKFKEGDEVICREHIGKWTVMEDEKDSVLVGIKDKCTGTIKAVTLPLFFSSGQSTCIIGSELSTELFGTSRRIGPYVSTLHVREQPKWNVSAIF